MQGATRTLMLAMMALIASCTSAKVESGYIGVQELSRKIKSETVINGDTVAVCAAVEFISDIFGFGPSLYDVLGPIPDDLVDMGAPSTLGAVRSTEKLDLRPHSLIDFFTGKAPFDRDLTAREFEKFEKLFSGYSSGGKISATGTFIQVSTKEYAPNSIGTLFVSRVGGC